MPGLLRPNRGDIPEADELAEMIAASERPLILSGHGVQIAGATDLLLQVAERAEIPVAHTLLGIGNIDETHRLSAGYAGMHGWMHANKALQQCDLLIGIGCRYDDRITGKTSTFAPRAKIVHVDVDRSEIGKNVRTDLGIVADAGDLLAALLRRLPQSGPRAGLDGTARGLARGQRGSVVARIRVVARGPSLRRLRGRADRGRHRPRGHPGE